MEDVTKELKALKLENERLRKELADAKSAGPARAKITAMSSEVKDDNPYRSENRTF